jgi:hypothetical protein
MMERALRVPGLVALLCATATAAAAQEEWKPYDFSHTKYIALDVEVTRDGETQSGSSIMEFEDKGDGQLQVHVKGNLGETSAEFTTTAPQDQLQGYLAMQLGMSPLGPAMVATMFAPTWGMAFVGRDMSVGSEWSYSTGRESVSFKVEAECSYAGQDGKQVVWRQDGEIRVDTCISPSVPLPLAMYMKNEDGEVYRVEMKVYESR